MSIRDLFIDHHCLICNHFGIKTKLKHQQSAGNHITKVHSPWKIQDYIVHFFLGNEYPLCACGCGQKTEWHKSKNEFNQWINNHNLTPQKFDILIKREQYIPIEYKIEKSYLENNKDFFPRIKCFFCGKEISSNPKLIQEHLYSTHAIEILYNKGILCFECNKPVANNPNVLARHLKNEHNIEYVEYIVKHFFDGKYPLCVCGCGQKTEFKKGSFKQFVEGHYNVWKWRNKK